MIINKTIYTREIKIFKTVNYLIDLYNTNEDRINLLFRYIKLKQLILDSK